MKNLENKFYNIHAIINANTIPMVDNSKWIVWSFNLLKKGYSLRTINRMASTLTNINNKIAP